MQNPFPQPLEERFSAVLSCVNTEWKSIVLAGILDLHEPKSCQTMRSEFRAIAGKCHVPAAPTLAQYADHTFVPIGLVALKVMMRIGGMPMEINEWCLTDAGERYGAPIAAFSLDWATRHNTSLYPILGPTLSPGDSRSPYNRAMLLLKLAENPAMPLRTIDLANHILLDEGSVYFHLLALKRAGFVNYDSVNPEERGWAKYAWVESKDREEAKSNKEIGHKYRTLKEKVTDLLSRSGRPMDCNEIAAKLSYPYPGNVSKILSDLKEHGYARCEWQSKIKQSDARITDAGAEFVESYIKPVRDALADGHSLNSMNALRRSVSAFAGAAAGLYYPHSMACKAKPAGKRIAEVLGFVSEHQNRNGIGPRNVEILRGTEANDSIIGRCIAEGLLEKRKIGKKVRYTLTERGRAII